VAFWVQGASDETRDAHYRAQRWAHVLWWQIDRLQASRLAAMDSHERLVADGFYPDEGRWPFFEMEAESHFALVAARQLLRALRAFDGDDRLPEELTNAQVRDVRDALEHWDTPGGSEAAKRLAKEVPTTASTRGVVTVRGYWATLSVTRCSANGPSLSTPTSSAGTRTRAGRPNAGRAQRPLISVSRFAQALWPVPRPSSVPA
jgi:hypothetical protein